jgi:hypothetical protein
VPVQPEAASGYLFVGEFVTPTSGVMDEHVGWGNSTAHMRSSWKAVIT